MMLDGLSDIISASSMNIAQLQLHECATVMSVLKITYKQMQLSMQKWKRFLRIARVPKTSYTHGKFRPRPQELSVYFHAPRSHKNTMKPANWITSVAGTLPYSGQVLQEHKEGVMDSFSTNRTYYKWDRTMRSQKCPRKVLLYTENSWRLALKFLCA